ncbi:MAG: hypothetical protein JRM74_03765 [Nitrososphaerota archaeon]|nr:hypothetical protein [Nitrososphaerota archaeon]MDG6959644.1 hypothetical protein [Nitrososphaerota archaeon]MDG6968921.1 hypothetical protein [Nitrososphaerota archaeon]MDG6973258.1 hypothetical protein [Nitrososphaerota archaeon]MDG6976783.1 hypothetical protein [Nitrososphaerota archaeon]
MKTLPAIAAVSIALVLALTPMIATAAGSITFTSPTAGASYSGSQTYTISGTISPAPTQADQVGITVKNPSGQTVDLASVSVSSGSFTYSTAVGGTSAWVTGTYTISALDSYGATGTTSFTYTAPTTATFNETRALLQINATLNQVLANQQTIMHDLSTISSTLGTISTNVGTILSGINSLTSTVGNIQTTVTSIQTSLPSGSAISATQTYVLVVAVLAAITLVLELAILVRKIS